MVRILVIMVAISVIFLAGCELSKYSKTEVKEYTQAYGERGYTLGRAIERAQESLTPSNSNSELEWKISHKGEDVFNVTIEILVDDINEDELEFEVDMRKKVIRGLNEDSEKIMRNFE